jgi:hypothetical protein
MTYFTTMLCMRYRATPLRPAAAGPAFSARRKLVPVRAAAMTIAGGAAIGVGRAAGARRTARRNSFIHNLGHNPVYIAVRKLDYPNARSVPAFDRSG